MFTAFFSGGISYVFCDWTLFTQQITQYSHMLKINLDRFYNTKKFLSFV